MDKTVTYFETWKLRAVLLKDGGVNCPALCHIHCLPSLLPRLFWGPVLPECEGAAGGQEGVDHHQPSWWRGHVLWTNHPRLGQEMWGVPALHVARSVRLVAGIMTQYLILGRETGHTRKRELFDSCRLLGIPDRWDPWNLTKVSQN